MHYDLENATYGRKPRAFLRSVLFQQPARFDGSFCFGKLFFIPTRFLLCLMASFNLLLCKYLYGLRGRSVYILGSLKNASF